MKGTLAVAWFKQEKTDVFDDFVLLRPDLAYFSAKLIDC